MTQEFIIYTLNVAGIHRDISVATDWISDD